MKKSCVIVFSICVALGCCFFLVAVSNLINVYSQDKLSKGWESTGISDSSQGKVWKPQILRSYHGTKIQNTPINRKKSNPKPSCEQWAVITTIFAPTKISKQISALKNWCLVIVADEKTDWNIWNAFAQNRSNIHYLSPDTQKISWL